MSAAQSDGQAIKLDGRIVWKSGDLIKGKVKTVFGSREPLLDKQGKQIIEFGFGLAVPKMLPNGQPNPQLQHAQQVMQAEAMKIYTNGMIPPSFAWKVKDGDGIDDKGNLLSKREGHAGCMIFALSTRIAIPFYKNLNGAFVLIDQGVKPGDYVKVNINLKAHPAIGQGKPGMYANPTGVLLTGIGEEIISQGGFNPEDAFGGEDMSTPFGAQAVTGGQDFGFNGQQQTQNFAQNNFQQQTQQQVAQPAQQAVQPHHAVLPGNMQPQNGGFPGQQTQQQVAQPAANPFAQNNNGGFPPGGQTNSPFPMK